jgi:superfamily II DNA/RNA helicase
MNCVKCYIEHGYSGWRRLMWKEGGNLTKRNLQMFHTFIPLNLPRVKTPQLEPKTLPTLLYKNRIKTSLTVNAPMIKKIDETSDESQRQFFAKTFSKREPKIIECLKNEFKVNRASAIQELVIPELLKGNDVLCAAQTGTGKTLAYVVPLLHRMKQDEISSNIETRPNRPRFIILVPSRELTTQVASVVKKFSHYLKFRCVCLRSDLTISRMKRDLNTKVDVVVSTPGIIKQLHDRNLLFYTDVRYVVVDEADTLLSKDFKKELTENILIPCRDREVHNMKTDQRVQFCFVLATFNNEMQKYMEEYFPRMKLIATSKLHHGHKNIVQTFIKIADHDKIKHLQSVIGGETSENRTIIFCNTVKSCRAVHHALTDNGISASCYHSEIPPEKQAEEFNAFASGEVPIMVCTDIASRGMDIPNVKHVVIFDFPLNTVDYLHRVGRTGRFGAPGKVTSLVNRPREIALANEIEKRLKSGASLDGVYSTTKKELVKAQKKAAAVAGQKKAQKGKRALYWERQKRKKEVRNSKMKSHGRGRVIKPIGSKDSKAIIDNISVPNIK